jgi:purine-binding chemotaxis protein CheW
MPSPKTLGQTNSAAPADARAGKYLTFQLAGEEFGIRVLNVREIMGVQEITAVPRTPAHIKGVINLRGKVIPVVDLRLKFALAAAEYTQRTCIIVTQVQGECGPVMIGIVVDSVSEVLNLTAPDIEDTPDFGDDAGLRCLLGMAKVKGKVKILLDIDEVLSTTELHHLDEFVAARNARGSETLGQSPASTDAVVSAGALVSTGALAGKVVHAAR